ncbi:ABC transporter permease [Aureispira anguillae]|uniref:ABC transporter permease n=1 Tax=Aureispira anguillae TaxID=2864201 RepID=A0A915YIS7_9BACT|nr:ABC transporter permease [Aureispira anguillae]BDS13978.1 ABC transporter permease [Aureispira anguillae]
MFKLWVAIKKEFQILMYDKAGLAVMFGMPLLLVYIITIVQDSAFKIVNENKISILVVNKDKGKEGQKLVNLMKESGLFNLSQTDTILDIKTTLREEDYLTGLVIAPNFTEKITEKATLVSATMMSELGLGEPTDLTKKLKLPALEFYHDPVLQENYCFSIMNMVDAFLKSIEGELFINQMCEQLDLKESPKQLKSAMIDNRVPIKRIAATASESDKIPNSTQHNVPAWTIFAMFFMVVSLGNNIVKERLNGSFIRLKTMPTSFALVLGAKMLLYLAAAVAQVTLIFSLAKITFPTLGLPELTLPSNTIGFVIMVLWSGMAAVSYALLVGAMVRTQEQSHGFGAMSIVILAAIGGIWVPSFVMPEYMQTISLISPLNWCLKGFYILFLKGGLWSELQFVIGGLSLFIVSCLGLAYLKLKKDKIV